MPAPTETSNFEPRANTPEEDPIRVALVHDWLTGFRGGERVLEVLCELFPEAPLYTLVYVKNSTVPVIENREIHTSFIQRLPMAKKKYRHYLPLFPLASETLHVKGYDLIVSTSSAVAKSVHTYGALHWCYTHTPMRYVWDRFDDYFGPEIVGALPSKYFFRPIAAALRSYDRQTSSRVDHYVANSTFVADRIRRFYGREAEVICPPVDTRFSKVVRKPEDFYLFFSALVPYKRADQAILACQKMKKKLVVLGHGPELAKLQKLADPNYIQFIMHPTDEMVADHLARAKALLFPTIEDFGIVPVEALSAGLPVIGLHQGGLLDSQTEKTCLFYQNQTVEDLMAAIHEFELKGVDFFKPEDLRTQAGKFSRPIFRQKVSLSIHRLLAQKLDQTKLEE